MNDWTIFESAMIFGIFCLIIVICGAVYGLCVLARRIYESIQREVKFRYYFREIRNPRKYAKRSRDKREPVWDFILKLFGIDSTGFNV